MIEKIFMFIFGLGTVMFSYLYFRDVKTLQSKKIEMKALSDSIRSLNGANSYYSNLLAFTIKSSDRSLDRDEIKLYDITADTAKSVPLSLGSLIKKDKISLILRYTEIGCNECSSMTIKKLNELRRLHPDLPIYALVDFSNYDSYLQWRKIGNINFPVYYLKKGNIVFDKDCEEFSYLFTVDNNSHTSNFFVPNSGMPAVLEYYFDNIYKSLT